jgi:hypothetical protein
METYIDFIQATLSIDAILNAGLLLHLSSQVCLVALLMFSSLGFFTQDSH